jgi:hypothetical protein
MAADLRDARAKFRWAKRHVHTVHAEVLSILDPHKQPFTTKLPFEPNRESYVLRVKSVASLPNHLGLYIGDALQCLRAALDRSAWALVQDGDDPMPKKPNLIQFPIYSAPEDFAGMVDVRLPGVADPKRAAIESRQPYHGRDDGIHLAALAKLSNDDKHRHVPAVLVLPKNLELDWIPLQGCRVKAMGGPLEQPLLRPDTELAYAQIWADARDHKMSVNCKSSVYIGFDLEDWTERPDVSITLARMRDTVRDILEDPVLIA